MVEKRFFIECQKATEAHPSLFDLMIDLLSTNTNSKKATEILAKKKIDILNYPKLVQRLKKKAARF